MREDGLPCSPRTPDTEFLRKRCLELSQEKFDNKRVIEKLKEDVARLHASAKNWFEKYQELVRIQEEQMLGTPIKRMYSVTKDDLLFMD